MFCFSLARHATSKHTSPGRDLYCWQLRSASSRRSCWIFTFFWSFAGCVIPRQKIKLRETKCPFLLPVSLTPRFLRSSQNLFFSDHALREKTSLFGLLYWKARFHASISSDAGLMRRDVCLLMWSVVRTCKNTLNFPNTSPISSWWNSFVISSLGRDK